MTAATVGGNARPVIALSDHSDHPEHSEHSPPSAGRRLRVRFAAVRLSVRWFGVRKTLTQDQKDQAADTFGAQGQFLSAAKKLLDTHHPAFRGVTAIRGQAISYWRGTTLPYPDPGVRLIRQEDVEGFDRHLRDLRENLVEAVDTLDQAYAELREAARQRLGRLYNPGDYPSSLSGLFALDWDFPSVEPPDYLRRLNPKLYEEESRRVANRFDEAVRLAEEAFSAEFAKLVAHITERLNGQGPDGKAKVFRDSAVENLTQFFEQFRRLNVHSSTQLDELVERARRAVRGVGPQELRENAVTRAQVASQLASVQASLDTLLVDRPRRRILRAAPPEASGGVGTTSNGGT